MSEVVHVVVLALIQGLSEFLPVSSSAHLVLPSQLLGWQDQGLLFDVAVHGGTLLAVMLYFRSDIGHLARDALPGLAAPEVHRGEVWRLALAAVPVGCAGLLAGGYVESQLRSLTVVTASTLIFGAVLGWAVWRQRHNQAPLSGEISWRDAGVIGLAQALAIVPGVSRSGVTISAAMLLGYQPAVAARFSFLLSIPTILGALAFMAMTAMSGIDQVMASAYLLLAFVVAAVSAYLTIALFLRLLDAVGLMPFVVYRLVLGAGLLALLLSSD